MSVRVEKVVFDAAGLKRLPKTTRDFLLLGGHMFNELVILHRFYLLIENRDTGDLRRQVGKTWSYVILRILAGKLFEFWQAVSKRFNTSLSDEQWIKRDSTIQEPLKRLRRYFGRSTLIGDIRNHAFHYKDTDYDGMISSLDGDEELEMFLSDSLLNTTHHFAELAISVILLDRISPDDPKRAHDRMMNEIIQVSRDALEFLNRVIAAIFRHHPDLLQEDDERRVTWEIRCAPHVGKVHAPLFVRSE